jgi:hypothetical protein
MPTPAIENKESNREKGSRLVQESIKDLIAIGEEWGEQCKGIPEYPEIDILKWEGSDLSEASSELEGILKSGQYIEYFLQGDSYIKWDEVAFSFNKDLFEDFDKRFEELGKTVVHDGDNGEIIKDGAPMPQEILKEVQDHYARIIMYSILYDVIPFKDAVDPGHLSSNGDDKDSFVVKKSKALSAVFRHVEECMPREFPEEKLVQVRRSLWNDMLRVLLMQGLIQRNFNDKFSADIESILHSSLVEVLTEEDRLNAENILDVNKLMQKDTNLGQIIRALEVMQKNKNK